MSWKTIFVGLVAAAAVAVPAVSQTVEDATAKPKAKAKSRMICEEVVPIGSRLGARKVCLTEEQWRAKQAEHRNETERAQRNVGIMPGS